MAAKSRFASLSYFVSIFLTNWAIDSEPIRARGIIVKYLSEEKKTQKKQQQQQQEN